MAHRLVEHYGGWYPSRPSPHDLSFNADERVFAAHQLARSGDLWDHGLAPSIWDQADAGSCTGHGSLRAYVTEANRQGITLPEPPPPTESTASNCSLSRLMQYWDTRKLEGTTSYDSGGQVRDALRALATIGCAPETDWLYDTSKLTERPPDQAYVDAKQHMAIKYQSVNPAGPGAPIRTALSQGLAVVFGFSVPEYFESGVWDPSEPLPLPAYNTRFIGGHCVAITGWDFTFKRFPEAVFFCDNSWGTNWGSSFSDKDEGGRFAIAADWTNPTKQLSSDFWVIQSDT